MNKQKLTGLLFGDTKEIGVIRFIFLIEIPAILLLFNASFGIGGHTFQLLNTLLLLYFLSFISALATAVYYIKDIYQYDPHSTTPFKYFRICFFGMITPRIRINHHREDSPWYETVEKIGGPVYMDIDPGYVVLTESLTAPEQVYGRSKKRFLSRRERIQMVVELREQESTIPTITANTKDGIQVIVKEVKLNYRIWDARWESLYRDGSNTRNPYPYSKQAILDYTYNRPVQINLLNQPEQISWDSTMRGRITGVIKNYIGEHKLDEIIAPREHPNNEVRDKLLKKGYEPSFKEGLREIGTILRWWDPGEFGSEMEVEKQNIANWSIALASNIRLNRAHGEAQVKAYEELGRAEAEAELLMSIIHSMDGIQLGKDKVQTLHNLILLRTAQVIRALNTNNHGTDDNQNKEKDIKQAPQ
ncbi:MAG: hypothetical protein KJZ72_09945 [Anaerolineales bacterium]|nr:hypothetical protein [Anaerolineales bacterium]